MLTAVALLLLQIPIPMPSDILNRLPPSALSEAQRSEVKTALGARDYARIENVIGAAAQTRPVQAATLNAFLGQLEFFAARLKQSEGAFRAAEAAGPLDERDRFTFAMALVRTNNLEKAREELETLRSHNPSTPLYLYWLGRIDYGERLYGNAVEKFQGVIALDPQSVRAYDNLGLSFDMQGKDGEARVAFERAVTLNRKEAHPSPWPPENFGYLLLRLQKTEEAEKLLREALKYDPNLAIAHYHLGRVLESEHHDADAAVEYKASITLDSVSPEPCYSLGRLYRRLNRPKEAQEAFAEYNRRKAKLN